MPGNSHTSYISPHKPLNGHSVEERVLHGRPLRQGDHQRRDPPPDGLAVVRPGGPRGTQEGEICPRAEFVQFEEH